MSAEPPAARVASRTVLLVAAALGTVACIFFAFPDVHPVPVQVTTSIDVASTSSLVSLREETEIAGWRTSSRHPSPLHVEARREERAVVALLLTHLEYHGTKLLATTLQGWIKHFFVPQGNVDLIVFVADDSFVEEADKGNSEAEADDETNVRASSLRQHPSAPHRVTQDGVNSKVRQVMDLLGATSPSPVTGDEDGRSPTERFISRSRGTGVPGAERVFVKRFDASFVFEVVPIRLTYPDYLVRANFSQLSRPDWLKCGCPPYCPARRATPEYVQGTRWYTHDMFLAKSAVLKRHWKYWIKLDVDIWFFRPLPFNLVIAMRRNLIVARNQSAASGRPRAHHGERKDIVVSPPPFGDQFRPMVFAHTGYAYNGGGCSNELHRAILAWCRSHMVTWLGPSGVVVVPLLEGNLAKASHDERRAPSSLAPVSDNQSWWVQDDNVYWSNFVVADIDFHTRPDVMALADHLNRYENGFFRYRWTDQSLFHKVFGVFLGPKEADFALDWTFLRCQRGKVRPQAVFYHGKSRKGSADLRRCTGGGR